MALITFPSIPPIYSNFSCNHRIAESESPFNYAAQTYDWLASRWEGEITLEVGGFKTSEYAELCELKAFIMAMNGKLNTFNYGDPEYLIRGPRGAVAGTTLVKGAAQTGRNLIVDGFALSTSNVVMPGDYLQLGSGTSARLYGIIANSNSDGTGTATVQLNRPLFSSPADNAAVVFTGAKGHFKLAENNIPWPATVGGVVKITIPFKEILV